MLTHLGADDWEDGPVSFLVPGSSNGFPRAWWPEGRGKNINTTGRFLDDFGNKFTVLAVGNPDKRSGKFELGHNKRDPETIAHIKGSGYGLVHFNKESQKVRFELWRVKFDAVSPKPEDQFPGFPYTIDMDSSN